MIDDRMEILKYEINSSWWVGYVSWNWAQDLTAKYFSWKVKRKYRRYCDNLLRKAWLDNCDKLS